MTENVCHVWTLILSHVAAMHDAKIQPIGVAAKSSEQHEEIGKSWTKCNYQDCQKLYDWLTTCNPF